MRIAIREVEALIGKIDRNRRAAGAGNLGLVGDSEKTRLLAIGVQVGGGKLKCLEKTDCCSRYLAQPLVSHYLCPLHYSNVRMGQVPEGFDAVEGEIGLVRVQFGIALIGSHALFRGRRERTAQTAVGQATMTP